MQFYQLSIVLVGQSSLGGDVNDQDALFTLKDVAEASYIVSIDVDSRDVKERLMLRSQLVLAALLNRLKSYVAH
jgi:hypothetical protein